MMDDVARFPGVFVAKKKKRASDLGDSLAGEDEGGRNSSFLSTQTEEEDSLQGSFAKLSSTNGSASKLSASMQQLRRTNDPYSTHQSDVSNVVVSPTLVPNPLNPPYGWNAPRPSHAVHPQYTTERQHSHGDQPTYTGLNNHESSCPMCYIPPQTSTGYTNDQNTYYAPPLYPYGEYPAVYPQQGFVHGQPSYSHLPQPDPVQPVSYQAHPDIYRRPMPPSYRSRCAPSLSGYYGSRHPNDQAYQVNGMQGGSVMGHLEEPCRKEPEGSPAKSHSSDGRMSNDEGTTVSELSTGPFSFSDIFMAYMGGYNRPNKANTTTSSGDSADDSSNSNKPLPLAAVRRHAAAAILEQTRNSSEAPASFLQGTPEDWAKLGDQMDKSPVDPRKYKTRKCHNWETTGTCPYEDTCCFAHGDGELRDITTNHKLLASIGYFSNVILLAMSNGQKPAMPPHSLYQQQQMFPIPETPEELEACTNLLPPGANFPFQQPLPAAVDGMRGGAGDFEDRRRRRRGRRGRGRDRMYNGSEVPGEY
jgi:hypothetical protein